MEVIEGTVSHLREDTHVSARKGNLDTASKLVFRIDSKIVKTNWGFRPEVSAGDEIVAVGAPSKGEFTTRALWNKTTGTMYHDRTTWYIVSGILLFLLGIPVAVIIVGFLMMGLGAWIIYEGLQNKKAKEMIEAHMAKAPA
jgi:hypothetical protein